MITLAAIHSFQLIPFSVGDGVNLAGEWEICAPTEVKPLDIDFEKFEANCHWRQTVIPSVLPMEVPSAGWNLYRKHFRTPPSCMNSETPCVLFLGGVVHAVEANLNGLTLGRHSTVSDAFPALIDVPPKLLRPSQENTILMAVYRIDRKQSPGISHNPVAIVPKVKAVGISICLIGGVVILPLLTAVGLLTLALMGTLAQLGNRTPHHALRLYVIYCLSAAVYSIFMSRLIREALPFQATYSFHFLSRFLMDFLLIQLACRFFGFQRIWIRILKILLLVVLFLFGIIGLWALIEPSISTGVTFPRGLPGISSSLITNLPENLHSSNINIVYTLAFFASPYIFVGNLLFVYGSIRLKRHDPEWLLAIFVMGTSLLMAISDAFTFAGLLHPAREHYYVRFYSFYIALSIGFVIWVEMFRSQRQTEAAAQVGALALQVAHDIRSPVAALQASVAKIAQETNESRLVHLAIKRIREMADSLLDEYKRKKPDRGRPAPLETNLGLALDEAIEKKRREIEHQHRRIIIRYTRIENVRVAADERTLIRILSNLLNNAVEAITSEGSVTVDIRLTRGWVLVDIADTGTGVPADVLTQLGMRGFSYNKTDGTGLGLYHAKSTLALWGGELEIRSNVGEGTHVTLKFRRT